MTTILVLTDEPVLEAGLRAIFASQADYELQFCGVPADFVRAASTTSAQVTLCVLHPGLDLPLAELRFSAPHSHLVVFGREIAPEFARQGLHLGVRGFASATDTVDELLDCIRTAATGELWMDRSLSVALLNTRAITLSRRQTQLVQLLAQGLKNKEIARALGISEGTVKAYLTALFEKVGVKDRFELALFGLKFLPYLTSDTGLAAEREPRVATVRQERRHRQTA